MNKQDKKLAKELKIALQEVKEEKTRPIEELVRELNLEKELEEIEAKPEKRKTKIDSTTLIRKDRER